LPGPQDGRLCSGKSLLLLKSRWPIWPELTENQQEN
jgi:hypothetical protein